MENQSEILAQLEDDLQDFNSSEKACFIRANN